MTYRLPSFLFVLLLFTQNCFAGLDEELAKGGQLWSEGKLKEAYAIFHNASQDYPDSSLVHARLGALLMAQHKAGDAINAYQTAITNDPTNAGLFVSLAISYLHQRSFRMAQGMANEALRLDPTLSQAKKLVQYISEKKALKDKLEKKAIPTDTVQDVSGQSAS